MPEQLFEAVPNLSQGKDAAKIKIFAEAIVSGGAQLLDFSADADHNRSVFTLVGTKPQLEKSLLNLARKAIANIDMRSHCGVHPCVGALDVLPIVPLQNASLLDAKEFAQHLASVLWSEFALPSLFYNYNDEKNVLANFRKNGFAGLDSCQFTVGDMPHKTAGAVAISARDLLIAFNVNLLGAELPLAKKIARRIRESSGGFVGVKALGLYLPKQKKVQVSMNLTDYRKTSPRKIYDEIARFVAGLGIKLETEVIGLLPSDALADEDYEVLGLGKESVKLLKY